MMSTEEMVEAQPDDAGLVAGSLAGNRGAFRQIVERYQTLVCSLAYCATGSVGQSEDIAQETFVAAWSQLGELREPVKLRSWLCGIARFRIGKQLRRDGREPVHDAETLEVVDQSAAPEPLPSHQAISNEEKAILWRSLERIPETYREPLVLFYREHQSIERVAEALELSEDTVKQRLSRGRKLLQEEFLAFVEGALEKTNPGQSFTFGVMTALPAMGAASKAAIIGATVAKGGAGKVAAMGISGLMLGLLPGALAALLGTRMGLEGAQSARERRFTVRANWFIFSVLVVFFLVVFGGIHFTQPYWRTHEVLITWSIIGCFFALVAVMGTFMLWAQRRYLRMRDEADAKVSSGVARVNSPMARPYEYRSRAELFGLPLVHVRYNCRQGSRYLPAKGWIAGGNMAYGIVFAAGHTAVGMVSLGGFAAGIFAFGGFSAGVFAFGAAAIGWWSAAGLAVGYLAFGGAAIGWEAASGGAAVSHYLATGGSVIAPHANDALAEAFMDNKGNFQTLIRMFDGYILLSWLPAAVGLYVVRRRKRIHKQAMGANNISA